jgi:hypothetical protein
MKGKCIAILTLRQVALRRATAGLVAAANLGCELCSGSPFLCLDSLAEGSLLALQRPEAIGWKIPQWKRKIVSV